MRHERDTMSDTGRDDAVEVSPHTSSWSFASLTAQHAIQAAAAEYSRYFLSTLTKLPGIDAQLSELDPQGYEALAERERSFIVELLSPATKRSWLEENLALVAANHAELGVPLTALHSATEFIYRALVNAFRMTTSSYEAAVLDLARSRLALFLQAGFEAESNLDYLLTNVAESIGHHAHVATTSDDLIRATLGELSRINGIVCTYVIRPDDQGTFQFQYIEGRAAADIEEQIAQGSFPPITIDPLQASGNGGAGRAWRTKEVQFSGDILHDASMTPWAQMYRSVGIRSACSIPLCGRQGDQIAILGLYSSRPDFFNHSRFSRLLDTLRYQLAPSFGELESGALLSHALRLHYQALIGRASVQFLYQPIVDLHDGHVHKLEALARLIDDDGSVVSPYHFLTALGTDDLYRLFELGINDAVDLLDTLHESGHEIGVSVNLPVQGSRDPRYQTHITMLINDGRLRPSSLTLEVTEEEELTESGSQHLSNLSTLGIRLAQDDLGSGYSSLRRLEQIGFDDVKIDQTLIRSTSDPLSTLTVMEHLSGLAHDLGISVVAEGLESEGLVEAAIILGVDFGQGYAIARPMDRNSVISWISSHQWGYHVCAPATKLGALAALHQWWRTLRHLSLVAVQSLAEHLTQELKATIAPALATTGLQYDTSTETFVRIEKAIKAHDEATLTLIINDLRSTLLSDHQCEASLAVPASEPKLQSSPAGFSQEVESALASAHDHQSRSNQEIASSTSVTPTPLGSHIHSAAHDRTDESSVARPLGAIQQLFTLYREQHALRSNGQGMQEGLDHLAASLNALEPSRSLAIFALSDPVSPKWTLICGPGLPASLYTSIAEHPELVVSLAPERLVNDDFVSLELPQRAFNSPTLRSLRSAFSGAYLTAVTTASDRVLGAVVSFGPGHHGVDQATRELLVHARSLSAPWLSKFSLVSPNGEARLTTAIEEDTQVARISFALETGQIVSFSAQTPSLYGYEAEEFARLTITDVSPALNPSTVMTFGTLFEPGQMARFSGSQRLSNGEIRNVTFLTQIIEQRGQRCVDATIYGLDRPTDSSLALLEEQVVNDGILTTTAAMILVFTPTGMVVSLNRAIEEFFGVQRSELGNVTIPLTRWLSDEDILKTRLHLKKAISGEENLPFEVTAQTTHGEHRYLEVRISVLREESGAVVALVASALDVTERHRVVEQIRHERRYFAKVVDHLETLLLIIDESGRIIQCNRRFKEMTGVGLEELQSRAYYPQDFVPPHLKGDVGRWLVRAWNGDLDRETATPILDRNAHEHVFNWHASFVNDETFGRTIVLVGIDISEQLLRERQLTEAAIVFDNVREAIVICDRVGTITDVNAGYTKMSQYSAEEAVGRFITFWTADRHGETFFNAITEEVMASGHWSGTLWQRRKDGAEIPTFCDITTVLNDEGRPERFVCLYSDATEIIATQRQLEGLAATDPLTKIPNRLQLRDRMEHAFAIARRDGTSVAVAYLDLDAFKPINDKYGHNTGDQILIEVAQRIAGSLREIDTVARIGGDEFVCILPQLSQATESHRALDRLLELLEQPLEVPGIEERFVVSASIGVVVYSGEDIEPDTVLRRADQLMYQAKRLGGGRSICGSLSILDDSNEDHEL
jgi:diguanylate cyclase (GGDEF)-like protein/PAS domain S-box-containing protein